MQRRRQPHPVLGAAVGAIAGLAGSWAMVRFNHLIAPADAGTDKADDSHPHRRQNARPNDTDGTFPDEPASNQVASAVAEPVIGRELTEREKEVGGPIVHYAFGAAMGAIYGATAEYSKDVTRGAGIPFGTAVWIFADEIGVFAAGLSSKHSDYPLSRHLATLGTHVVFGLTVEGVRRALRAA